MLSPGGAEEMVHAPRDHEAEDSLPYVGSIPAASVDDPRQLVRDLASFRNPRLGRSIWELAVTLIPFLLLCGAMLTASDEGYWLALLLSIPAGLLLLRLFLIQHDCGHGSFLRTRSANDWLGRILGILTLTPYDCWRRSHALHHAGTGNLDARGFGDIDTLTVQEFRARSRWGQLRYRLYRNPAVMLGLGPAYLFLLRHRLPIGLMKEGRRYWISAMLTNAATAILLAWFIQLYGIAVVAAAFLPMLLISASMGVWLFYVQHQFEEAHWDHRANWSFHDAAMHGSSHLDLPRMLRWFTANIGVHHVHHLVSRIPFYRLPDVLRAYPHLKAVNRHTAIQTFATLRLALWDEQQRKMVALPPYFGGGALPSWLTDLLHLQAKAAPTLTRLD